MNYFLKLLLFFFSILLSWAADKPNILIILADDCTYNDLPLYGGENARTPNIDKLASEGLTFNKAYVSSSMCQPCRAELYSGLYPMGNGCAWNHSGCRTGITGMRQVLGELGYRVGLAGKTHIRPADVFPFEKVEGFDPSCVRNPTIDHDLGPAQKFMERKRDELFCLVIALTEPHVPWVMGDASQYPPKKLKLPPNIADTPRTREDFSKYLAEITYMDGQGVNGRLGIPDCTPPWLPVGLEKSRRGSVRMHLFSMPIYCPHCWTWLGRIPPDLTDRALAEC